MEADLERLTAYTYLTVQDRAIYIAIMRVFTSTLLADLSAHDLTERLDEPISTETVADKLERLRTWGNLILSSRPAKAGSIREYHRVRSRYQLSTLGERIQRQADEILASADAAREVSRELLALVARGLIDLDEGSARPGGIEPRDALDRISTLFAQFRQFADSVRDFYAYLGQVIFRYDLDSTEFAGFKELLLDYAETITDDVTLFAPQIEASIRGLWPRLPELLATIDEADQGLAALRQSDIHIQRSRGRHLDDWIGLRAWFFDEDGQGSQVDQLRDATLRALQALLANAKRMIRSSSGGLSRRRDLLKLAQWFDAADDSTAHDLFTAAFGLYGARHLGLAPDHEKDIPATTSWRTGPAIRVPLSLKERGTRAPRGRTAGPENYQEQQNKLRERANEEALRQRAAAAELRAAGLRLPDTRLSGTATRLLLDLLARSLAGAAPRFEEAETIDEDLDVRVCLTRTVTGDTVVHGADGDLLLEGLTLAIGSARPQGVEAAE